MSLPPKTLIKSRKNLQEIYKHRPDGLKKYEFFDNVLLTLWIDVKRLLLNPPHISLPNPTSHIINLHTSFRKSVLPHSIDLTETLITELIEVLKTEYPDVDFTYKETAGYNGKILERIIIMDWS